MLPELSYEEALVKFNLKTLEGRRQDLCINLIKSLLDPSSLGPVYEFVCISFRTYNLNCFGAS
jgi:hypothetical protein